ncbi:MAG: carboxypeptidase-like regulatory domain-containing protein [Acidobacteriota bacterium]
MTTLKQLYGGTSDAATWLITPLPANVPGLTGRARRGVVNRHRLLMAIVVVSLLSIPALAQSGSISGKVKERDGKVLEGVLVVAAGPNERKAEARSNEKGEFELTELKAGDYVLSFERRGFQTFTTRRLTVNSGETVKLSRVIELSTDRPTSAIIRGAVFTADGFSLPNANIKLERLGEGKRLKRETISVEGGEFGFRLPAEKSTYRITASARGFEPATLDVEVDSDEVRQIALTLKKSGQ